jgi:hypothetical protein
MKMKTLLPLLFRANKILYCLLLSILFSANVAHATAYACIGTVTQVATPPNGTVNATFNFIQTSGTNAGSMPWETLCSLTSTYNGVDPNTCKGVLSTLTTAHAMGSMVMMWFDNTTSPSSCSATGWQALGPAMGWYWGPSLQ